MKNILIIVLSFMLVACGSDEESSTSTFLEGTWKEGSCDDINDALTEYIQSTFQYSGDNVTITNDIYDNSNCSGTPILEARFQGVISIGDDKIISSGETVTQYTITLNSVVSKPLTQAKALNLSNEEHCGFNDWSEGIAKSIFDCQFPEGNPDPIKEIAMIDGNTLYRGAYEQKDETGYSTELEVSEPLTKQ